MVEFAGIPPIEVGPSEGEESEATDSPGQVGKTLGGVRGGRSDRSADTRRYHTAGAIEDIKVRYNLLTTNFGRENNFNLFYFASETRWPRSYHPKAT